MLKNIAIGLLIILNFSGCSKSAESTYTCTVGNYDPCAFKAPASEIQAVKDYLAANNIVATEHCSGLFYSIDVAGTGANPDICSRATVNYEGKLTDGTVFESKSGAGPFPLSGLIPGWRIG